MIDTAASWTPEAGTPQGAVISPLLANIYLDPLDWLMLKERYQMTRYADDFVVQCTTEAEATSSGNNQNLDTGSRANLASNEDEDCGY